MLYCTRRRGDDRIRRRRRRSRVGPPADNVSSHIAQLVEQSLAEWDLQMASKGLIAED